MSPAYSSPGSLEHEGSRTLLYWMHLTLGLLPQAAIPPHPLVTETNGAHLSLSSAFAEAQPLLLHSPPQSFSLHTCMWLFAIRFSLTPCVSSHPSFCQILTSRLPLASIHCLHPSNCADIYISKAQCVFMSPPTSVKQGFSSQIYSPLDYEEGEGWTLYRFR